MLAMLPVRSEDIYKSFTYNGTVVINGLKYAVTLPESGKGEALLMGPDKSAEARGAERRRIIYMHLTEEVLKFFERDVTRTNGRVSPPPFDMFMDSRATKDNYFEGTPEHSPSPAAVNPDKEYTCELKIIGTMAFSDDVELESVELPEGVTTIWGYAFNGCKNLKQVILPSTLRSIGSGAFGGCSSLTSIHVPDGVTDIQGAAFSNCEKLVTVNLPKSLKNYMAGIFWDCKSLKTIDIPNTMEEIPLYMFYGCENLETVTGGQGVKKIRNRAFGLCYNLSKMSFSNVLDSIGEDAFIYNYKLPSFTIPRSLSGLGKRAFQNCIGLKTLNYESGSTLKEIPEEAFYNCGLTSISLPVTVKKIGRWSFGGNDFVTLAGLPEQLEEIGDSAFRVNQKMIHATIPSSVTSVGEGAFEGCYQLETVDFGVNSKLKYLGDYVFIETALNSFVMPDGITSIGIDQFPETLQSIQLSAGLKSIPDRAFKYYESLQTVTFGKNAQVESIGKSAFEGLPLTSVELPSGLKTIGEHAFAGCKQLKELIFPSTLTSISDFAFAWLDNLKEIVLPEGIMSVGSYAFADANNVTSLLLPESLSEIGEYAFRNIGITSLRLPKEIKTIGAGAFNSPTIRNVYVEWESTPATLGYQVFNSNTYNNGTLHVPTGTATVYQASIGWKNFENIDDGVAKPYVVFNNGTLTFYCDTERAKKEGTKYDLNTGERRPGWDNDNKKYITTVVFDASFASARPTSIFYWFHECNNLTEIQGIGNLNTSEITNMSYMFYRCNKLTSLDLSRFNTAKVTNMVSMFAYCESLTKLDVSNFNTANVTSMDWMFTHCTSLENLDLSSFDTNALVEKNPDGGGVGEHAYADMFRYCTSLTTLTLGNKFVTKEGLKRWEAFYNNTSLEKIVFNGDIPASINSRFFDWVGTKDKPVLLEVPAEYRDHYAAKFNGNMFFGGYFKLSGEQMPGDLNGDNKVDGMDLVAQVNIIMGTSAQTSAADLNGDGRVDGMDYVAMVNIIMGKNTATARGMEQDAHHIIIGIEPLSIAPGESRELTITLQNEDLPVTLAQMDMTLPQGLTLTGDYSLSSRTTERDHQLYMSGHDGQHRLMLASPKNSVLTGSEGAILHLTLTADESFEGGDIVLRDVLCVSPDLQAARQQQAVFHLTGTTGITANRNSQSTTTNSVYRLSGQRLTAPRQGVNIIDGKKVIIK